jgi:enamine deaminase RidA (YjgF/YER057c/UK114 family)
MLGPGSRHKAGCLKLPAEHDVEVPMPPTKLNPASIRAPFAAYSHGIALDPGARLVFASGQLGMGADDVIPEDVEAQAVLCFENIRAILAEAGMTMQDVVRFNAFVTDRAYFPVYGRVRSRYVTGDAFASTLVIVSGFTRPEFKVEVEVTAARFPE